MFKNQPEVIYNFSVFILTYIILFLHLIIILIPKFIFYIIPKYTFKLLKKLNSLLQNYYLFIHRLFKFIFLKIWNLLIILFNFIKDHLEYLYIIILLPIIIPIFIVFLVVGLISLILKFLIILIKSLFGIKLLEANEIIYFKNNEFLSNLFFKNLLSYLNDLKYKYRFKEGFSSVFYLMIIISFQLFYISILGIIFYLLLTPFSIIIRLFKKEHDLESLVIINKKVINGIINFKNTTYYNHKISFKIDADYYYDSYNQIYILKDDQLKHVSITILNDNKPLKKVNLSVSYNHDYHLLKTFNYLKNELLQQNYYHFNLPTLEDDRYIVSYEKVFQFDKIIDNHFYLRNYQRNTSINVLIYSSNDELLYKEEVNLFNLINPSKLLKSVNRDIVIKVRNNSFIPKYLDKGYEYIFNESKYINKEGLVLVNDDLLLNVSLTIKDIPEIIYYIDIFIEASKDRLNDYLKDLTYPIIDWGKKEAFFNDLVIDENYNKEIDWYLNHEKINKLIDPKDLYIKISKLKKPKIQAIFSFNNKYITHNIILNKDNYYDSKYELLDMILEKYFNKKADLIYQSKEKYNLIKNKRYLKLPITGNNKILLLRWKSLNKKLIKSSGLIINDFYQEVKFKVYLYENIFKKHKYITTII